MRLDKRVPLDCLRCPAFCCKVGGYVEATARDVVRLARFLGLTRREFLTKHAVKLTTDQAFLKGRTVIKSGDNTCQVLGADHRCTVYAARPEVCREYVCWNEQSTRVYEYAAFAQLPVQTLRKMEGKEPKG